ncbi:C4-dicarboxylate ABC transporter [Paenibacillus sp. 5J-6]|uniref:C4-dicarboxylate ABC transporter n=1 Tax=Paenibacillus silvestris TaxID=2606219 RepID=A0A6L8V7L5_9BACL|nr:C4-dicarboxylate ABC transporter [Paenibacillus silvestris]MZQ86245.1 C4-dicarboxylate ABC transporter [Paenibacillus silvestris]
MRVTTGKWLGWIGIILAVIGFFYAPVWMGSFAVVLGLICLATPKKGLAWWSVALGVMAFIIPYFR